MRQLAEMANARSYLAISGFSCEPHELTLGIGIAPTKTSAACPDRSGFSYWELEVPKSSLALEDHVECLIEALRSSQFESFAYGLRADENVQMNFFVSLSHLSEGPLPHLILNPVASEALAKFGICLVVDMN